VSEENRAITGKLKSIYAFMFGRAVEPKLQRLLANGLGCSDKSWNMICLNRQLHFWWAEARFGLKCLGITRHDELNSRIQVQFYWLPRHNGNPKEYARLEVNEVQEMLQGSRPCSISASRVESNRSIVSGQIFEMTMEHEEAANMKLMVDVQWALIRIAAMSGAAGAPELLDDPRDPDSDFQVRVRKLLERKEALSSLM